MSDSLDASSPIPRNPPQHNILISIPRTASNLVTHILALPSQPSILPHPRDGYFFLPSLSYRFENSTFIRPYDTWSPEEKQGLDDALSHGVEGWKTWVDDADAQGKGTFVKEHVNWALLPSVESSFLHASCSSSCPNGAVQESTQTHDLPVPINPTAIPDAFWTRVRATFLIRHPALTFPSALRTAIDNEGLEKVLSSESDSVMRWECTFHWHVLHYNVLVSQHSLFPFSSRPDAKTNRQPLIIDAAQLQDSAFVRRYASLVGLDSSRILTSWAATPASEQSRLNEVEKRMRDTLLGSTGVVQGKLNVGPIDIGSEKGKWETEFGRVLAERLDRLVQGAMAEYEWLYERRWRG